MELRHLTFEAIGTTWSLQVGGPLRDEQWQEVQAAMIERIDRFDQAYSRFRDDSWVTQIAPQPGRYELPPDGHELLQFYEQLYEATDGLVTPLIGQVMVDAGYDASYSLQPQTLTTPPAWQDVLTYTRKHVMLKQPALLDFGAAGKGYVVDQVGAVLESHGVHDYIVDAGGDMLHRSPARTTVRVGLENPRDHSEVIGVVELGNASLCASSGSRRQWSGYHHLINPKSLKSPADVLATWVIADDTMTADGLATALFFVPPRQLARRFRFAYAVLHHDMNLERSTTFPATTFAEENR